MQLSYYEELLVSADDNIMQQKDRIKKKIFYLTMYLSKYGRVREYLSFFKE